MGDICIVCGRGWLGTNEGLNANRKYHNKCRRIYKGLFKLELKKLLDPVMKKITKQARKIALDKAFEGVKDVSTDELFVSQY